jgi:hypothetical protein
MIDADDFAAPYHGHNPAHLRKLVPRLRQSVDGGRPIVWLAGDSSLDNKHWVKGGAPRPATQGYEAVLSPPLVPPDVAGLLNTELARRSAPHACVNAAVEESTLGERKRGAALLPQDEVLRELLEPRDALIVSVGGNDLALRPTTGTLAAMGALMYASPACAIAAGCAPGLAHLVHLFGPATGDYIRALCARAVPSLVVVCMIYYPQERRGSWADAVLGAMGYDSPAGAAKAQAVLRQVFARGTARVTLPGVPRVVPLPLYEVLDASRDSGDYVARVEPSERGGQKMAAVFADLVLGGVGGLGGYSSGRAGASNSAGVYAAPRIEETDGGSCARGQTRMRELRISSARPYQQTLGI